jgi:hypothetical protein
VDYILFLIDYFINIKELIIMSIYERLNESLYYKLISFKYNDVDKIKFLLDFKKNNYPFELEAQPDAILSHFFEVDYSSSLYVDELTIAQTFVELFGKLIICRESTYCFLKPMTIIDELEYDGDNGDYKLNYRMYNLHKAFTKLGVYKAEKYSKYELLEEYKKCDAYANAKNIDKIFNKKNKFQTSDENINIAFNKKMKFD